MLVIQLENPLEISKPQPKLAFSQSEFDEIFKNNFLPEDLIGLLEKQYPTLYDKSTRSAGGYSLKQHSLMVMRQFEKYFGDKKLPADIDKNKFRLFLAMHDIGKPDTERSLQHLHTQLFIKDLFRRLNIDDIHKNLALTLAWDDPLGRYIMDRINIEDTSANIKRLAMLTKIPIKEYFEIFCIYYKVDAGAYTKNAWGFELLDHLFIFDEENHKLIFAPQVQEKIDKLEQILYK